MLLVDDHRTAESNKHQRIPVVWAYLGYGYLVLAWLCDSVSLNNYQVNIIVGYGYNSCTDIHAYCLLNIILFMRNYCKIFQKFRFPYFMFVMLSLSQIKKIAGSTVY